MMSCIHHWLQFTTLAYSLQQLYDVTLAGTLHVYLNTACHYLILAQWRHMAQRSGSTLVQVMASCFMAPSHYLNQCWLIISDVQWHSYEGNFTRDASNINHYNQFENYITKILFKSPRANEINLSLGWSRSTKYAVIDQMCLKWQWVGLALSITLLCAYYSWHLLTFNQVDWRTIFV